MRSKLFDPWRDRRTWWNLVHVLLDLVVGVCTFPVVFTLLVTSAAFLVVPFTWPLAVITIWCLFLAGRIIGHVERSRFASLLDLELSDPVPPLQRRSVWRRLIERLRVWPRWRELIYGLLLLPLSMVTTITAVSVWAGSFALVLLPLYVNLLPGDEAQFGLFELSGGAGLLAAVAVGILGFIGAPWMTYALAELDKATARRFLGPRRKDELGERVTRLETSRAAAVDSAESERRRIERDLHDGAQQRLVALAMGLGAARERLETDPDRGQQLVAEAHEEAKAALRELRDLVRGIHPVILEDRGLDPALSAVVARSPVPVNLRVEVPERPSPAVESTAYFVVSEALTNIARHAEASQAHVAIVRAGDRLVIEVRDDGVGGADADKGSGLSGLRNRVAAHDGVMHVISPPGGPTTLLVDLPCGDGPGSAGGTS